MLIEFIPVMLFILGWNADAPGEIDLQREPFLFSSIAACEAEGAKVLARMTAETEEVEKMRYSVRCVEFPDRSEYQELLKREFDSPE